jgi:hypothetical protein
VACASQVRKSKQAEDEATEAWMLEEAKQSQAQDQAWRARARDGRFRGRCARRELNAGYRLLLDRSIVLVVCACSEC